MFHARFLAFICSNVTDLGGAAGAVLVEVIVYTPSTYEPRQDREFAVRAAKVTEFRTLATQAATFTAWVSDRKEDQYPHSFVILRNEGSTQVTVYVVT